MFPLALVLHGLWLSTAGVPAAPVTPLQRCTYSHPQMGTVFKIVIYAADTLKARAAAQRAFDLVDTLNAHLSDYLPDSELNRLCARAGTGEKVPVSPVLWDILRLSHQFSTQSNGAFDATVGNLTRLWRRARNLKTLPDSARILAARALTDYRYLHFYEKNRRIRMEKAGMQLDLGGIAQGYAADACLKLLKKAGFKQALVDAGGDIAAGEAPPGANGWRIELPAAPGGKQEALLVTNCGITTSGATFRYVEVNGTRYSHIIDPRTGWGLTRRVLVTVQAPTGVEADAWATALSVMGREEWQKMEKKSPRLKVWLTETAL